MFKWPPLELIKAALHDWALEQIKIKPDVLRLGYFGSYARGDFGVGSDLDLIAIVGESVEPFDRRRLDWPVEELPIPAEILVYTEAEWRRLLDEGNHFARRLQDETVWLFARR